MPARSILLVLALGTYAALAPAAVADPVAVNPDGDASCSKDALCVAVSGTGNSSGWIAASGTGEADAAQSGASGTGDASGLQAVSATGDAENSSIGVSALGDAEGYFVASATGEAEGTWLGASATGDATGWVAVAGTGDTRECSWSFGDDVGCVHVSATDPAP